CPRSSTRPALARGGGSRGHRCWPPWLRTPPPSRTRRTGGTASNCAAAAWTRPRSPPSSRSPSPSPPAAMPGCPSRPPPGCTTPPLRRFDPTIQAHSHGFLNVFGAGVLAHARRLDEGQVRPILEDQDPSHFAFDAAGFHWGDCRATAEEVAAARRDAVVSFGS